MPIFIENAEKKDISVQEFVIETIEGVKTLNRESGRRGSVLKAS